MLFSLPIDSECHHVIDYLHIKSQYHEWVHFIDIVLEVTYNVVEGPMCEDLVLLHKTIFEIFEVLIDKLHRKLSIWNLCTPIISFLIWIIVIEIKFFNELLNILHDLLS